MNQANFPAILMTADEARVCVSEIKTHLESARARVLDLFEREGWRALGYSSWASCVTTEFGQSRSQLYNHLDAALIERDIAQPNESNTLDNIGTVVQRQLLPLKAIELEQRSNVWHAATSSAPNGQMTGQHVQNVVNYVRERQSEGVSPADAGGAVEVESNSTPCCRCNPPAEPYSYCAACAAAVWRTASMSARKAMRWQR